MYRPPSSLLLAPLLTGCLFLTACGGGSGSSSSDDLAQAPSGTTPPSSSPPAADTKAPEISSRLPDDQATDVSTMAAVTVVFDESLDATSVDTQSIVVTEQAVPVAGSAAYDANARSLVFTPESPFAADTVYEVNVASDVADMAGNRFLGATWFFTTGGPFNLGPTSQIVIDQCMDDGDKLMLTLVNNVRAAGRTCGSDTIAAQAALAWNCRLDQAALDHSTSMANNDFHDHVSPVDGSDPGDRIRATGYMPQTWGENIAAGYSDENAVMDGWLLSPGHCANLMGSGFTEMGAAAAENSGSTFGIYWTQNFARPL